MIRRPASNPPTSDDPSAPDTAGPGTARPDTAGPAAPDLAEPLGRPPRVLVTGAGGPAGVCFLRALTGAAELFAADIDPHAVGLYLTDRPRRHLLPRGDAPEFAERALELCRRLGIDVLVPTVDTELVPLALFRRGFEDAGVHLLLSPAEPLETALDKWRLLERCRDVVPVPDTAVLGGPDGSGDGAVPARLRYPLVAKPRRGSGSRGIRYADGPEGLAGLPRDGSYLVQEMLPGREVSVDVLARPDGQVVAAVPRTRAKVDSGISVAGRVLDEPALAERAAAVVRAVGLRGIANVQLREDRTGRPALLEVNPRPPGGLSMTIAAGVPMPAWAVAGLLGLPVPDRIGHRAVDVVRHWEDIVLPAGGIGDLGAAS